jgi:hypothetical protein
MSSEPRILTPQKWNNELSYARANCSETWYEGFWRPGILWISNKQILRTCAETDVYMKASQGQHFVNRQQETNLTNVFTNYCLYEGCSRPAFLPTQKVKFSLSTLRTDTGSGGAPPCILNLGTIWRWSASRSGLLTSGERTHNTHWAGDWSAPEPFWTLSRGEKSPAPARTRPISHYTDPLGSTAGYETWCFHIDVAVHSGIYIMSFYNNHKPVNNERYSLQYNKNHINIHIQKNQNKPTTSRSRS